MKSFYIGQRVSTSLGDGTVSGFERITHVNQPITCPTEFQEGDRVAVALDTPSNWVCHKAGSRDPYFMDDELQFIWEE